MKKNSCENQQAILSRKLITKALFELMEDDSFQKITIIQICDKAMLSRQTFYRNFESKEDVIQQYLNWRWERHWSHHPLSLTDGRENLKALFADLPFPQSLLLLLERNGVFHLIEDSCYRSTFLAHAEQMGITPNVLPEFPNNMRYYQRFLASTISCILQVWTNDGFIETPEELSELCILFFSGTAGGYVNPNA